MSATDQKPGHANEDLAAFLRKGPTLSQLGTLMKAFPQVLVWFGLGFFNTEESTKCLPIFWKCF